MQGLEQVRATGDELRTYRIIDYQKTNLSFVCHINASNVTQKLYAYHNIIKLGLSTTVWIILEKTHGLLFKLLTRVSLDNLDKCSELCNCSAVLHSGQEQVYMYSCSLELCQTMSNSPL